MANVGKSNWKIYISVPVLMALSGGGGWALASDEKIKQMIEDNPVIVTMKNDMMHLKNDFKDFKVEYKADQNRASDQRDDILAAINSRE